MRDFATWIGVLMPEAPVNKNYLLQLWHDDVGMSRKAFTVQAIAIA